MQKGANALEKNAGYSKERSEPSLGLGNLGAVGLGGLSQ
jgi:hypothetical protein